MSDVEVVAHTYRMPMRSTFESGELFAAACDEEFNGAVQDITLSIDAHLYVTIYVTRGEGADTIEETVKKLDNLLRRFQ